MKLRLLGFVLVLVAGLWQMTAVKAALIVSLAPSAQTGSPGGTVAFSGTLSNSGGADVFLNGTASLSPVGFTVDDTPFFLNTPLFLAPGGSFSGGLFDVAIAASVTPATYAGSFTVRGGADANELSALATAEYLITIGGVTAVAEPSAQLLLATALAIGWISRRWTASSARSPVAAAA